MWWYRLYTLFPCGYLHPRIRHHGLWWGESTSCFAVKMLGKTGQLEYLQPEYHDGKSASGYSGVVFCSWVSSGELEVICYDILLNVVSHRIFRDFVFWHVHIQNFYA